MKKFLKIITRHPIATFAILWIILVAIFRLQWYWYLAGLCAFLIAYFLITLPTSLATLTYMLSTFSKKNGTQKPGNRKIYEWCYQHKTKSEYALVSYGLDLCRSFEYEHSREVLGYLLTLGTITPSIYKTARLDYAIAQWKCGDLDGAIATTQKMQQDYEIFSAPFFVTLGYFYFEKGDLESARKYSVMAISDDNNYAAAYDNLAQVEWAEGNKDEAVRNFKKALSIKSMADSHYGLGLIAEAEGNLKAAAQHYSNALNCRITGLTNVTRETIAAKFEPIKDHLYDETED